MHQHLRVVDIFDNPDEVEAVDPDWMNKQAAQYALKVDLGDEMPKIERKAPLTPQEE